jgi:hypothetical protein
MSAEQFASAILRLENEPRIREELIRRGRERCGEFDWRGAASGLVDLLYAVGRADADSLRGGWRNRLDFWPGGGSRHPESAATEKIQSPLSPD